MFVSAILVLGVAAVVAAETVPLSRVVRDSQPAPVYTGQQSRPKTVDISSPLPSGLQLTSNPDPNPVYPPNPTTTTTPPHHKLIVGNWIAQWDTKYKAWFYYNINTEKSTWVKPKELRHVSFKDPDMKKTGPMRNSIETSAHGHGRPYGRPFKRPYSANGNRRTIVETGTDEYYGLDTSVFKNEGVFAGIMNQLTSFYEDTGKDYISDLYSDALEDYFGGTVQLVGWFLMGSFAMVWNEMMIGIKGKRGFAGNPLTEFFTGRAIEDENGNMSYTLPFMEDLLGLEMRIPIDESLAGCYKERESCVNKDFPAEVDHLLENIVLVKNFFWKWLELSEKIGVLVDSDGGDIEEEL